MGKKPVGVLADFIISLALSICIAFATIMP